MIRVLLYGDIDLNLIDGSAIWLASLAEVLGGIEDVSVSVLQKTPITRDVVIRSAAALPNVRLIDPWSFATGNGQWQTALSRNAGKRLAPETAAAVITVLDREEPFNALFIRSPETCAALVGLPHLAPRVWAYVTDPLRYTTPGKQATLRHVAALCAHLVCQTEEAKEALVALLGPGVSGKVMVLPPMIPEVSPTPRRAPDPTAPRLGYSGKFSPPYMILEMLDAFEKIRARIPGAEFHIVGDKFHNSPPIENFVEQVKTRLTTTPGVIWHGGVSRAEANDILSRVNVASSWRAATFDHSLELSTKILEYSALGIPVLMNPTPIQRRVFGSDFPGYASTEVEFIDRFLTLVRTPALYERASRSVQATAAEFSFENSCRRLARLLKIPLKRKTRAIPKPVVIKAPEIRTRVSRPLRILFNGHDLKFIRNFIKFFSSSPKYEVQVEEWKGHNACDERKNEAYLRWADVIFCEWCLGNAKRYSERKRPGQRLFIRLHHQEMGLPYRWQLNWRNVDALIFTNYTHYRRFQAEQPEHGDKALVIFCDVDCEALDQEKLPWAEFNLGLVGINPMRKRPDMALEILAKLRKIDSRFTLFFKTRMPWEYNWLWERPQEREYYGRLLAGIDGAPHCNAIVFDGHGDDMASWYSKIGFILSTSDHEGSHQAVAEGMAAGCIPVVRNWDGATPLYPPNFIYSSVDEAVRLIQACHRPRVYAKAHLEAQRYARQHFHSTHIVTQLESLFQSATISKQLFPAMSVNSSPVCYRSEQPQSLRRELPLRKSGLARVLKLQP